MTQWRPRPDLRGQAVDHLAVEGKREPAFRSSGVLTSSVAPAARLSAGSAFAGAVPQVDPAEGTRKRIV